ncbi:MAG: hypothetical protein A2103_01930 [Gammaproteobacteria bacterium GWF2_41_13]|nr:MAG: hypothetical protein A2103_01930 [Gammaproteobacteria bacterium GWF2_41_13]
MIFFLRFAIVRAVYRQSKNLSLVIFQFAVIARRSQSNPILRHCPVAGAPCTMAEGLLPHFFQRFFAKNHSSSERSCIATIAINNYRYFCIALFFAKKVYCAPLYE